MAARVQFVIGTMNNLQSNTVLSVLQMQARSIRSRVSRASPRNVEPQKRQPRLPTLIFDARNCSRRKFRHILTRIQRTPHLHNLQPRLFHETITQEARIFSWVKTSLHRRPTIFPPHSHTHRLSKRLESSFLDDAILRSGRCISLHLILDSVLPL